MGILIQMPKGRPHSPPPKLNRKFYMYIAAKKELTSIPLDELYHDLVEANNRVSETTRADAILLHNRDVANRIAVAYSGREDSYEGNADQDFPFKEPTSESIVAKQAEARKAAATLFAAKHKLDAKADWFLPQLTAHIAKIPLARTPEGQISSKEYTQEFKKDDFHRGIWALGLHPLRGDIVPKQYTPEGRSYCALVPLLLMPHKRFNNVKYSEWSRDGLANIVDTGLYQAMTLDYDVINTPEELLSIRTKGLTTQTGKNAGTVRNSISSPRMYALTEEFKSLPWLAQAMLFQIWCAHPANRTDLMVLDWKDWDSMPPSLIPEQLFKAPSVIAKASSTYKVEKDPYSLF